WPWAWLQTHGAAYEAPWGRAGMARAPRKMVHHAIVNELPAHDPQRDDAQVEPAEGARNFAAPGPAAAPSAAPNGGWWPGLLWLAGTGILLARFLVGRALLVRLRRQCPPVTDGGLLERVQAVARRLGLRGPISIREAQFVIGPATFGVRRPTLILPKSFADHAPAAQEAMLAHELAHLAGQDTAWQ